VEYLTDEEQVERLRRWWKEYGLALVSGVVIAVLIVIGTRYYRRYEAQKAQNASMIYTTMMSNAISKDDTGARVAAKKVISTFPSTPYASLASLWLGQQAAMKGDLGGAIARLRWTLLHSDMDSVRQVSRLRLARIYLAQKAPEKALQSIDVVNDKAYVGLIDELKGDAYVQLKKTSLARKYYQKAMVRIPNSAVTEPMLSLKLADLPANNA
jgi:predicted negative regulator of RcsB-dependent stress response